MEVAQVFEESAVALKQCRRKAKKCRGTIQDCERLPEVRKKCQLTEFCQQPMLGKGECLVDCILRDNQTLEKLGITHRQLAQRMKGLMLQAKYKPDVKDQPSLNQILKSLGKDVQPAHFLGNFGLLTAGAQWSCQNKWEATVDDHLLVSVVSWGGAQECPFKSPDDDSYYGYKYGADDVLVLNLKLQQWARYSSLLPHMIKHHHFFEGQNSTYRADPQRLAEVLEVKPGIDYKVPRRSVDMWQLHSCNVPRQLDSLKNQVLTHQCEEGVLFVVFRNNPNELWSFATPEKLPVWVSFYIAGALVEGEIKEKMQMFYRIANAKLYLF